MHKVVRGIDVFDVGRGQLLRFWQSDSPLYFHRYVECVYHTQGLELGSYVVVALSAKFGVCDWRPRVCDLFSGLDDALDAVSDFYWCNFYDARVRDTTVLADYEIWHVVDDMRMLAWESRVRLADLMAYSDGLLREDGVNVHELGNPFCWHEETRCDYLELCVYDSNFIMRDYYRLPVDKAYEVVSIVECMSDMFEKEYGKPFPWRLIISSFIWGVGVTGSVLQSHWPIEECHEMPF